MKLTEKSNQRIGLFFAAARKAAGLSQGAIMKKLDLSSNQYVSNIERGHCPASEPFIQAAIDLYKMDPDAVVDELQDVYCTQLEEVYL